MFTSVERLGHFVVKLRTLFCPVRSELAAQSVLAPLQPPPGSLPVTRLVLTQGDSSPRPRNVHVARKHALTASSHRPPPPQFGTMAISYPPLEDRPLKNTICLFDVDGTLTPARRGVSAEMLNLLARLRQKCAVGFVGGSDLVKQQEQLGTPDVAVTTLFDFCFAENGLTAYKNGEQLPSNSFIRWLGEAQYKELVSFCLHYVADLDIPVKRGTFVEFRNGMVNVSPIGRNASVQERNDYEKYDKEHHVREKFVEKLRERFGHLGLT